MATLDRTIETRRLRPLPATSRCRPGSGRRARSCSVRRFRVTLAIGWEIAVRCRLGRGPPAAAAEPDRRNACGRSPRVANCSCISARRYGAWQPALPSVPLRASSRVPWPDIPSLFRSLVDPSIQGLRAVPSLAWVPLFILWLGIFEESKIALIAVGVFFPVYLGVTASVLGVDRKIVEVGRIFRLKGYALVRRILVPAILPSVCRRAAHRARSRLDVRGRGRDHGRVRGARLSVCRRPATRQARPDRRRDSCFCGNRQDHRCAARRRQRTFPALAGFRTETSG